MLVKTLKISDKGQIVIPKAFVKHLGSNLIKLEVRKNQELAISPVRDLAGSLTAFAYKEPSTNFNELRNKAWDIVIKDKFKK